MHECPQHGIPVLVVYTASKTSSEPGAVRRFYACAYCDCCALWPNWQRGLKNRAASQ